MPNARLQTLDDLDVAGKAVLLRLDLNVPVHGGEVADATRITRQLPTIRELVKKKARVIIISHFDRPGGKFVPSMSLSPVVDALATALGHEVRFGVDSIGPAAREAVNKLKAGEVLLLENLRFHGEEEKNDPNFSAALASLAECFVSDAFSCAHRAHASTVGVAKLLPSAAGRLMQEELETLESTFSTSERPLVALVGGSKISSKLALLENLLDKVDALMIGGAMANTFLLAQGGALGTSLVEKNLKDTALHILNKAKQTGCELLLPVDAVAAESLEAQSISSIVPARNIPEGRMALDIGPETVQAWNARLASAKTVMWNGPLGAFETSPFDIGTVSLARMIATLTRQKKLRSVAGGGDTVAALSHAGLAAEFSYLSTAGGAFLEWLEGKELPGVAALLKAA